jgi:hypothetical protein
MTGKEQETRRIRAWKARKMAKLKLSQFTPMHFVEFRICGSGMHCIRPERRRSGSVLRQTDLFGRHARLTDGSVLVAGELQVRSSSGASRLGLGRGRRLRMSQIGQVLPLATWLQLSGYQSFGLVL